MKDSPLSDFTQEKDSESLQIDTRIWTQYSASVKKPQKMKKTIKKYTGNKALSWYICT